MTGIYVAIGGALGAVLRYGVSQTLAFPYGTLAVNVIGCLVMGLALVWFVEHPEAKALGPWQPFVMTGVLGGFTTYSAFSLDALRLFERGQVGEAALYAFGTVILCLAAVLVGAILGRGLWL